MGSKILSGVITKKAHIQERYTEEAIQDLSSCAQKDGYLHFAKNFFHIQHPTKGKIKFIPYEYQERLFKSYHDYQYSCNMLPRQSGKCLEKSTKISIKHKITGEVLELTMEEFFKMQKKQ